MRIAITLIAVAVLATFAHAEEPDWASYDKDTLIRVIKGQQERITLLEHEAKDLRSRVARLTARTSGRSASSFQAQPQAMAAPEPQASVSGNLSGVPAEVKAQWRASWQDQMRQREVALREAQQRLDDVDTSIEAHVKSAKRRVQIAQNAVDEWRAKENTFSLSINNTRKYGHFSSFGIGKIVDQDTVIITTSVFAKPVHVSGVSAEGSNEDIRQRLRNGVFKLTDSTVEYTGDDGNTYEAIKAIKID